MSTPNTPKRLDELTHLYQTRLLNEALKLVNGSQDELDDGIFEEAVHIIKAQDLETANERLFLEKKHLLLAIDEQRQEISDLRETLDEQRNEYKNHLDDQRSEYERYLYKQRNEHEERCNENQLLAKRLEETKAILQYTQTNLDKSNEQLNISKRELIQTKNRLRRVRLELYRTKSQLQKVEYLLRQALSGPRQSFSQKITGLFLKLAGGVAFSTGLAGFAAGIASGNSVLASLSAILALGGFIAGAMVEINLGGLFEQQSHGLTTDTTQTENEETLAEMIANLPQEKRDELIAGLLDRDETNKTQVETEQQESPP
jgi:hypothetical protein